MTNYNNKPEYTRITEHYALDQHDKVKEKVSAMGLKAFSFELEQDELLEPEDKLKMLYIVIRSLYK